MDCNEECTDYVLCSNGRGSGYWCGDCVVASVAGSPKCDVEGSVLVRCDNEVEFLYLPDQCEAGRGVDVSDGIYPAILVATAASPTLRPPTIARTRLNRVLATLRVGAKWKMRAILFVIPIVLSTVPPIRPHVDRKLRWLVAFRNRILLPIFPNLVWTAV